MKDKHSKKIASVSISEVRSVIIVHGREASKERLTGALMEKKDHHSRLWGNKNPTIYGAALICLGEIKNSQQGKVLPKRGWEKLLRRSDGWKSPSLP
jgi:hypothetical protein